MWYSFRIKIARGNRSTIVRGIWNHDCSIRAKTLQKQQIHWNQLENVEEQIKTQWLQGICRGIAMRDGHELGL
jgi:hypothetical protein